MVEEELGEPGVLGGEVAAYCAEALNRAGFLADAADLCGHGRTGQADLGNFGEAGFDGLIDSEMFGGALPLGVAAERFVTGDVLVHTWDLATAAGQDTSIDADFAAGRYEGMLTMDDVLGPSGHVGPRVEVPDDADPVTKPIAVTGRTP